MDSNLNAGMSGFMNRLTKKHGGFTLTELMIAVVLIAIISGIAVSAYRGYGDTARQGRAVADITALNDALVRYYQTGYTYAGADAGGGPVLTGAAGLLAVAGLQLSTDYTFSIIVPAGGQPNDGQSYVIRAVPTAGGTMAGKGSLAVDNLGQRCYFPGNDAVQTNLTGNCPQPI